MAVIIHRKAILMECISHRNVLDVPELIGTLYGAGSVVFCDSL